MIEIFSLGNENFSSNGDMVLTPNICDIFAQLNNDWSLELEHPIDKLSRWSYIREGARVRAPSFNGDQLFSIEKVQKTDGGIYASAKPVFLEAGKDCFLLDIRPTNKTGQEALTNILSPNSKYSGISNIAKRATAYYILKNAMEAITGSDNSFLERWGGEILFDNYTITINDRIGFDKGISILYGKNVKPDGLSETVSIDKVVTRIIPKAYNGYILSGSTPWVDSPLINSYPTIRTKVIEYPNIRLAADVQGDTDGLTICQNLTELYAALRAAAQNEFTNGIDKPVVNIKVDMALIQNTKEYEEFKDLEQISLGDTVYCEHDILGIVTEARVVGLTWNAITESFKKIEIGEPTVSFVNRLASSVNSTEKALTKYGIVKAEQVNGIINGSNASIRCTYVP